MGNEKGHRNEEQTAKMVSISSLMNQGTFRNPWPCGSCQHPYQCWHEAEGTFHVFSLIWVIFTKITIKNRKTK